MTVIAAVAREGQVVMAADDAATINEADRFWPNPPKVARLAAQGADVILGWAGAAEFLPYFRRNWRLLAPGLDLEDWAQGLAEELTAAAEAMTPSCVVSPAGSERGSLDGMGLLGYTGRLWTIDANIAAPIPDGVAAIGSGGHVAIGVLHGALAHGARPSDAARHAVEVACQLTTSCHLFGGAPVVTEIDHPRQPLAS